MRVLDVLVCITAASLQFAVWQKLTNILSIPVTWSDDHGRHISEVLTERCQYIAGSRETESCMTITGCTQYTAVRCKARLTEGQCCQETEARG